MIKITKFGGSSVADAGQFKKVKRIIEADEGRRFVVVSAAGNATAVVTNKAVAAKMVADAYTNAQVIKEIATGEEYGIAINKDNADLLAKVNDALQALTDDGTMDSIVNKYFG